MTLRRCSAHLAMLSLLGLAVLLTWFRTTWIFYKNDGHNRNAPPASVMKLRLEESKQLNKTTASLNVPHPAPPVLLTTTKRKAVDEPKEEDKKKDHSEQQTESPQITHQQADHKHEESPQPHNNIDNPDEEDNSVNFHFIISTQCSSYQVWETLSTLHSAEAVHQCGQFTWIVSGCLPDEEPDHHKKGKGKGQSGSDNLTANAIRKYIQDHFPTTTVTDCSRIHPRLHFTPDYSDMSVYGGPFADGKTKRIYYPPNGKAPVRSSYGNHYYFNNKPNGLLHWAKEQQQQQQSTNGDTVDEAIVLIDPDFLFLTRFHLARPDMTVVGDKKKQKKGTTYRDKDLVFPGKPAAASYGLGAQWRTFNRSHICGADSPCVQTTHQEVHKHYSAGPPYVIHRADVLPLATKWAELVPATYDEYPLLYAEMYAYSMAAAHLQLPHHLINGLFTGCMVGFPNPKRWNDINATLATAEQELIQQSAERYRTQLVDELKEPPNQVRSYEPATSCFVNDDDAGSINNHHHHHHLVLPPMYHYCRRYVIPTTDAMKQVHPTVTYRFFGKRRVPHNTIMDCDDHHDDHHNDENYFVPFASTKDYEQIDGGHADWNALAVCAIVRALNFARHRGCARRNSTK